MKKDYYTVHDIAVELDVNEKAVRRLIKIGKLEGHKVLNKWVISAAELKEFIEGKDKESI